MLNSPLLLDANLPALGKRNPLTKPSRFYSLAERAFRQRESKFSLGKLRDTHILPLSSLLIQTARFQSGFSPDRLHYSNRQSDIGWDNWQPTARSSERDDFDYKVDRWRSQSVCLSKSLSVRESRSNLIDRFSQIDKIENPELDFFTTVLSTDFAEIDPQLDSLLTNSIDVEIPTPTNKDRPIANVIQPQSPGKVQSKSVEPDRKLLKSNQIEQPKSSVQSPQVLANIQPQQISQTSPDTVAGPTILSESSIGSLLDNFGLNTVDDSFLQPLPETSIDLNLDMPISPELDLTQISRSVVDVGDSLPLGTALLPANQTTAKLASPSESIPDPIVPNLLDPPTIIDPVINPQVAPLEPEVKTIIIPESAVSPENITPVTVLEQLATATNIAPIPESLDRLRADPIAPNPTDLPILVDSQLPEIATTQPPLLATATENIPSIMPLAIEPVGESISDTLPADLSDLPITNRPPSIDPSQVTGSSDELAIAHLDVPALLSNPNPTTSPLLAEPEQIATVPDRIAPEIASLQPLNTVTPQLNLTVDRSNIDRDSDPPIQLEPANPNIPELSSTLPTDALSTNLLPAPNPEQIVSVATPQLNSPDLTIFAQTPSALEQISRFTDEPTPANLESLPIPIIESTHTLSEPDLTIESSPRLNVDALQLNRSLLENTPIVSTEAIEIEQDNVVESNKEFSSENSSIGPLVDPVLNQTITDSFQNISQIDRLFVDTINESDDMIGPINNPTNPTQVDLQTTVLSTIGQEESSTSIDLPDDNSADPTIPAPTVGYATGGYVKDANHIDLQSIASSDTVSAMLTPGEFVINAKDAQKNLDLLTHINRGGEPESALPNTEIQPSIIESPPTSTDISPTSIQRKRNDSLISLSLQREIGLQQLSPLTNPGLDTFESSQTEGSNSSPTYSSPSMIFRKSMSSPQPRYTGVNTPDRWGSIEDLIDGGSNNSDTFSFDNTSPQQPDLEPRSSPSMSSTISPQYASPIRGFANGGEVTPSDISTTIEPITQTIESPINNPQPQPENNDPAELEILAREIYHRLRQRLEIERERHGSYSGNLAW